MSAEQRRKPSDSFVVGDPPRLAAVFLCESPDKAGTKPPREFNGARCVLPDGTLIEVRRRRVPLYDLARELSRLGYGDWVLQAHTPGGTPSLRGLVKVMAELTVEESDRGGLRLRKYRPLPPGGSAVERDEAPVGTWTVPERKQVKEKPMNNLIQFPSPPRLFRAWTVVKEHKRQGALYRDVTFAWFVAERAQSIAPPHQLLEGYQPGLPSNECGIGQESALADINECLTETELGALRDYLREVHDDDLQSREVDLPTPIRSPEGHGVLPIGAIAVGGATDFYTLSEEPEYGLPVKIWGYFDVRDCEYEIIPEENTAPPRFPPWARRFGPAVFV